MSREIRADNMIFWAKSGLTLSENRQFRTGELKQDKVKRPTSGYTEKEREPNRLSSNGIYKRVLFGSGITG